MAKATKKSAKSSNGQRARKPNKLHDTLVRLLSRSNGATITDISEAGFKYAVMAAMKIVERRGYKTTSSKKPGELTIYKARKV